ncbi:MAG: nucleotide exchange factor GrpE [Thermodesulfobacteriota bacterium]|nr:nucleotide exchange factor GrpE [Thermodesulfobacteriota bacterium]
MSTNARARNQSEKTSPGQPTGTDETTSIPVIDKNERRDVADSPGPMDHETPERPVDPIVELEEQLVSAQEEAKVSYDRFLRVSAEFDNYKKRISRETSDSRKYANETLLKELLSVVDNLERALTASEEDDAATNSLIDGVEMTLGELLKIFEKFAVKPVEARGKLFDPTYHQAMGQEKTDKHPENTITQELQKGYTCHDRLLRPAMVILAKPGSEDE